MADNEKAEMTAPDGVGVSKSGKPKTAYNQKNPAAKKTQKRRVQSKRKMSRGFGSARSPVMD